MLNFAFWETVHFPLSQRIVLSLKGMDLFGSSFADLDFLLNMVQLVLLLPRIHRGRYSGNPTMNSIVCLCLQKHIGRNKKVIRFSFRHDAYNIKEIVQMCPHIMDWFKRWEIMFDMTHVWLGFDTNMSFIASFIARDHCFGSNYFKDLFT